MSRLQCEHCPWKVNTDPNEIPNGYSRKKHAGLKTTIADRGGDPFGGMRKGLMIMACHETPVGAELPCVGWLANQLGPGNNLPLRLAVSFGKIDGDVETVGPQHERFEDTLSGEVSL